MDKIEETATHEVTHMVDVLHDTRFYSTHSDVKLSSWMLANADKSENRELKIGTHPPKIDKSRCNYHLCRKKTWLKRCKYCGGYFCRTHRRPKLSMTFAMVRDEKNPVLAELYEKEWRRKDGHPDIVYGNQMLEETKKKEEEYTAALDRMKSRKPVVPTKTKSFIPSFRDGKKLVDSLIKKEPEIVQEVLESKPPRAKLPIKYIIIIVLVMAAGFIATTYFGLFCKQNFVQAYSSGASFGRDPSTYCNNTCKEQYNSTIFKVIEPNATNPYTVCYCDTNNCRLWNP